MLKVGRIFRFHAAHHLPFSKGKCARVHGHTYRLRVWVCGVIGNDGMVIDFEVLERIVCAAVIDYLDHQDLNTIINNPTAENIVQWIWQKLAPEIEKNQLRLDELELWETDSAVVSYSAWKPFRRRRQESHFPQGVSSRS